MNITVVGLGAIGSLWSAHLQKAGHHVAVWTRQSAPSVTYQLDSHAPVTLPNRQISHLQQADVLLVCVKAWQIKAALTPLLTHLHPDCILVLMHNGMGVIDELAPQIKQPVVLATTTHGALRVTPENIQHTGWGQTQLGAFNSLGKQCAFLADVFEHALANVTWHENILPALWTKLAINCAINPLTALHAIPNGELAHPNYRMQIETLVKEVATVMHAANIVDDAAKTQQQLFNTVMHVIQATASNFSSMQQDIEHQRMTEIDFITGYVIKVAQQYAIAVPENQRLYQLISQQQARFTHV